tara:strand:+ start:1086 stop:1313 length:228 start_codon:yes stop_codon:yes gene_type:complete
MERFCKSCGMPMDKPEDFANNNVNSDYCYYCGDKRDSPKQEETLGKPNYIEKEEYYQKKKKVKKKKAKKKIKKRK